MQLAFEYFYQYLEEPMSTNKKPARWLLLAAHLGIIVFMMACAAFSGAQQSDNDLFRFKMKTVSGCR
jgi:ABC-type uncharacterized transport system auxiliary subunit